MKQEKKAFVLYQDFWSTMELLSMIDRGRVISAAFEYHGTGVVTVALKGKALLAFEVLRTTLERDAKRYEERCRRNSENGKKGGRPKKVDEVESNSEIEDLEPLENIEVLQVTKNPEEPKKADRGTEREKEKEIGIDMGRGGGIETEFSEAPSPKAASVAAPPPSSSSSSPTWAQRDELYRLGVPQHFWLAHWQKACEEVKEKGFYKPTDLLYMWWKEERKKKV